MDAIGAPEPPEWTESGVSPVLSAACTPRGQGATRVPGISEGTGIQRISFAAESGIRTRFFGYPQTNRLLHCEGANAREYRSSALLRIPCVMGVGSSGALYIIDLDAAEAGSVVAVNVGGDEASSYGTALGSFARRLYAQSEHCARDC